MDSLGLGRSAASKSTATVKRVPKSGATAQFGTVGSTVALRLSGKEAILVRSMARLWEGAAFVCVGLRRRYGLNFRAVGASISVFMELQPLVNGESGIRLA